MVNLKKLAPQGTQFIRRLSTMPTLRSARRQSMEVYGVVMVRQCRPSRHAARTLAPACGIQDHKQPFTFRWLCDGRKKQVANAPMGPFLGLETQV